VGTRRGDLGVSTSIGAIGLALLTIVSCALDERELRLSADDASSGGAFDGGGASGGSPPGSSGGDAIVNGGQSASDGLVDGCADLDTDGVADCEETLVENSSFTTTVDGWQPEMDAMLSWHTRNALDDGPSGSLRLTTKVTQASAVQCLSLAGERLVIAYVNAFVEATEATEEEDEDEGRAVLAVTFFESEGCLGDAHAFFETPASAVIGEWTTLQAGGLSRATTRSLSVALVGVKAALAIEQTLYFDNVMLKAVVP
jgi:hypothetical protein